MKVYDLDGIIIERKWALIAISLPKPEKNNAYCIYKIYNIGNTNILIHFKDFLGLPFQDSSNLESFNIDLNIQDFANFDFESTSQIRVVLIHHNFNELPDTPENVFDNQPLTDTGGKGGIIRG
jgi:hypothetical protein